jgi:hypothetical protein
LYCVFCCTAASGVDLFWGNLGVQVGGGGNNFLIEAVGIILKFGEVSIISNAGGDHAPIGILTSFFIYSFVSGGQSTIFAIFHTQHRFRVRDS